MAELADPLPISTYGRNPFVQGNYAPVASELSQYDLSVHGQIPLALNGLYVRTGPNACDSNAHHHWFNGRGMLHGVRIGDGRAHWYKARWIGASDAEGDAPPLHLSALANGTGNSNLFVHAGRLFAINDQSMPYELDASLATLRRCDFSGRLAIGMNSHPKVDAVDGSLHTLGYDLEHPQLRYHAFDRDGHALRSAVIDLERPIMAHEFMITSRHVVYFDLPLTLDMESAFAGEPLPYRWNAQHQARIGLASRDAPGNVDWYPVDPCYVLHGFNAFDDGGDVVIDVVRHERMFDRLRYGPGESRPRVTRWRVMRRAGRVVEDTMDTTPQEFPTIDRRLVGRPHRYGYAVGCTRMPGPLHHFGSNLLIKQDFTRGEQTVVDLGKGSMASEFQFVPRAGGRAEDDGWLLGFVYDADAGSSALCVLSAQRPDAGVIARIALPRRVPFGFHGTWYSNSDAARAA